MSPSPGTFLVTEHALQITSGALLLHPGDADFRGPFLGLGDPIYNGADSRLHGVLHRVSHNPDSPAFARLFGTRKEIEESAASWGAGQTTLLTGADASRTRFWSAIESKPAIIHLATHILEDEKGLLNTGWIALSLGADGEPEYLTPPEIAARTISARLVVLSGCSSSRAEIRKASGLMGLTRAWIAAGAGAVLATRWPTEDDDSKFFEVFYRNLRETPGGGPAEALRLASVRMLNSGNWRSRPAFWAGYVLFGNY